MKHKQPPATDFTVNAGGGKKHTAGKPLSNHVSEAFVQALSHHMSIGVIKYQFGNWCKGLLYSQVLESLRRHYSKLRAGEDIDPETNSHHLLAIAANAMMAWCLRRAGKLTDDRKGFYIDQEL